jgi:DNA ligase 1
MSNKQLQLFTPPPLTSEQFWKTKFSPMLGYNKDFDQKLVTLPVFVSEKIDGIRCIIEDGSLPRTREEKLIPNDHIRNELTKAKLPVGLDGELITVRRDGTRQSFYNIYSDVMSEAGYPRFEYHVFDWVTEKTYKLPFAMRLRKLEEWFYESANHIPPWLYTVEQEFCATDREYQDATENWLANPEEHEGCVLRSPDGPYKFGRSTFDEQYMLKLVPWKYDTATITQFEEEMINDDTSCKKKENYRPANQLGALWAKWSQNAVEFKIGSGFDKETKGLLWDIKETLVGKTVKFKYKPYGTKYKPRTPIFVAIL